jgi:predicted PurR-regulated permease PerM
MLVEGPTIIARFWSHYNNQTKKIKHQAMASKMYHIITGYFNGQVLVAIINALMTLCAMTLFSFIFGKSIPYQFALTATVFFCSLIPMFGAMLGAAIVTIVAMFVNVKLGLCLLAYFIIYQQIENATIQPMIHGRAVSMSPLLIIIIMLCSISLGGIVAALFALPIAGCIQVILSEEMREVKANRAATIPPRDIEHSIIMIMSSGDIETALPCIIGWMVAFSIC